MTERMRMSIASRARLPESRLLRVVLDPADSSRVIADPLRRLPGRGAWIEPDPAALELAERRGAFARALRVPHPVDTRHVHDHLTRTPPRPASTPKGETTH